MKYTTKTLLLHKILLTFINPKLLMNNVLNKAIWDGD